MEGRNLRVFHVLIICALLLFFAVCTFCLTNRLLVEVNGMKAQIYRMEEYLRSSGVRVEGPTRESGINVHKKYGPNLDEEGRIELIISCNLREKTPGSTLVLRYREQGDEQWSDIDLERQLADNNFLFYQVSVWLDHKKDFSGQVLEIADGEAMRGSKLTSLHRATDVGTGAVTMLYSYDYIRDTYNVGYQHTFTDNVHCTCCFDVEHSRFKAFEVKEIKASFMCEDEIKEFVLTPRDLLKCELIVHKDIHNSGIPLEITVKYQDGTVVTTKWEKPLSGAVVAER